MNIAKLSAKGDSRRAAVIANGYWDVACTAVYPCLFNTWLAHSGHVQNWFPPKRSGQVLRSKWFSLNIREGVTQWPQSNYPLLTRLITWRWQQPTTSSNSNVRGGSTRDAFCSTFTLPSFFFFIRAFRRVRVEIPLSWYRIVVSGDLITAILTDGFVIQIKKSLNRV